MVEKKKKSSRKLGFIEAIGLLIILVSFLIWCALFAKIPTGMAILTCGIIAAAYGMFVLKIKWDDMLGDIMKVFKVGMGAILILLMVGLISGSWLSSGTTPILIYYGLQLVTPSIYLVVAFVITAIAGMATGSAWAIIGSFGIALMGVATGLGIPTPLAAAAICAGSYLGDKWSPLSDVTNLVAAVTEGTSFDLFATMIPTALPGFIGAIIIYGIMGIKYAGGKVDSSLVNPILDGLSGAYSFTPWLLIPPILVIVLAIKKKPILPVLILGVMSGSFFAVAVQKMSISEELKVLYSGYVASTGDKAIDKLLTGGGLSAMMGLILIIFCAFIFAGIIEQMGMLDAILVKLSSLTKSKGNLVLVSAITTILGIYLSSSVYVSTIVNGRMWTPAYKKAGLDPKILGRTLTESGSYTGAIVPWSGGALIMLNTFGVQWYEYTPYMFNHWISLACVILFAYLGKFMKTYNQTEEGNAKIDIKL